MPIVHKDAQWCLTCQYWCGSREIVDAADVYAKSEIRVEKDKGISFYAQCKSCHTKGMCSKTSLEHSANNSDCPDWLGWQDLRK